MSVNPGDYLDSDEDFETVIQGTTAELEREQVMATARSYGYEREEGEISDEDDDEMRPIMGGFARENSPESMLHDNRPRALKSGRPQLIAMTTLGASSGASSTISNFDLDNDPELQDGLDNVGYSQIPDGGDEYYDVYMSPPVTTPEELPEGRVVKFTYRSKPITSFGNEKQDDAKVRDWYVTSFDHFPASLLHQILVLLDPVDLCRLARVSHRFHDLACRDRFWKHHYVERFGPVVQNFRDDYCTGYKDLFAEKCRLVDSYLPNSPDTMATAPTPNRLRQSVDAGPDQQWSSEEEAEYQEFGEDPEMSAVSNPIYGFRQTKTPPSQAPEAASPEEDYSEFHPISGPNKIFAAALRPRPSSDDEDDW